MTQSNPMGFFNLVEDGDENGDYLKQLQRKIEDVIRQFKLRQRYRGRVGRMRWIMEDLQDEILQYRYEHIEPTGERAERGEIIEAMRRIVEFEKELAED